MKSGDFTIKNSTGTLELNQNLWDIGTVVVTFNFGDEIPKRNYS